MIKFNKLLVLSLLFSTSVISSVAQAAEQTIATINRDDCNTTYKLIVNSTQDNREIKALYKDVYMDGKKAGREILNLKGLNSVGIILEQRDEYVVMKLESNNFDEAQGGIINIDTLYNGINGKRKNYELALARDRQGWVLLNQGKEINSLLIQSNKVIVAGTVGIKNLVMK